MGSANHLCTSTGTDSVGKSKGFGREPVRPMAPSELIDHQAMSSFFRAALSVRAEDDPATLSKARTTRRLRVLRCQVAD